MASSPLQLRPSGDLARMLPLLAAVSAACRIDVDRIPVALEDVAADAGTEPVDHDADGDLVDASPPPSHAACSQPAPDPLPALPSIASTAAGRPEFDLFRELACDQVTHVPRCDQPDVDHAALECAHCLGPASAAADAVCVPLARRGCVAVSHGPACVSCVAPEVKARACCLGLEVDCRPWPFEASSGPGELCARHADCQPGLICAAAGDETRFGVCSCPGDAPADAALNECLWERGP